MNTHTSILARISAAAARHPWRVIVVWVMAMALSASLAAPKLWQVTTNDTSHFLPSKYESVRATQFGQAHFGQLKDATAVTALVRRTDGKPLTPGRPRPQPAARRADGQLASRLETIKADGTQTPMKRGALQPVVGPLAGDGSDQLVVAAVQGRRPRPRGPAGVQAVPQPLASTFGAPA